MGAFRGISGRGKARILAGSAVISHEETCTDGLGPAARFSFPSDLAVDTAGNVYVSDSGNCTVRMVLPDAVSTIACAPGACEV